MLISCPQDFGIVYERSVFSSFKHLRVEADKTSVAVGPAGVSTLYALSVHNHILNGQLVWVCLLAVGAASIALTWSVKPPRGWRHVEAES